jgi:hypothetical protein
MDFYVHPVPYLLMEETSDMCHRSLTNLTSYHERVIGNTYRNQTWLYYGLTKCLLRYRNDLSYFDITRFHCIIRVTLRGMEKQTVIFASGNISRKVPYNKLCTSMNFYVHPVPSELHKSEFKTFSYSVIKETSNCLISHWQA